MNEFDEIARLSGLGPSDDLGHILPQSELHKSRIRFCNFETGNRLDGSTASIKVTSAPSLSDSLSY